MGTIVGIKTIKNYQQIWDEAVKKGYAAVEVAKVVPMVVQEHQNMLNDNSPVVKSWNVEGGCCGFAWISIRPASKAGRNDCPFVKWLRTKGIGRFDDYEKSWSIWVSDFGQSMQRKETYADMVAAVLQENGIRAYSHSRMD